MFCYTPSITRVADSAPSPGANRFRRGSPIRGEPVQPGLAARGHRRPEGNGEVDGPRNRLQPKGNGYKLLGLMAFLQRPLTHSSPSLQHLSAQTTPDSQHTFLKQVAFDEVQHFPPQQISPSPQHFPRQQVSPSLQHLPEQQVCPWPQHVPSPQQVSPTVQHFPWQAICPLGQVDAEVPCPSAARGKPRAASTAPPSAAPTEPSISRRETGLAIARDTSSNSELIVLSPLF